MAARFGRNKRRAAREAVASAEARAAAASAATEIANRRTADAELLVAHLRRDLDELCEELLCALGPDTALLPISRARRHQLGQHADRWPVSRRTLQAFRPEVVPTFEDISMSVVNLFDLVMRVAEDPMRMQRDIRIIVERPGDRWAVAGAGISLSTDRFKRRGVTDREVDFLFEENWRQLKAYIGDHDGLRKGARYG